MTKENRELLEKIIKYAENADDVFFLGLIGSGSNGGNLNDEYSDLDLILVTDNLTRYFDQDAWLSGIDEVWITFTESAADINYFERRCVYGKGLDADFIIVEKDKICDASIPFPVLNEICHETLQVLTDKERYRSCFDRFITVKREYTGPTEGAFANLVNDFCFHYLWAYKKCLRGEYWTALKCVNGYLKNKTLTMIEWYEHSLHGREYNTFYQGRHLEKWAEPSINGEIPGIFSSHGKASLVQALDNSLRLFTRVAKETGRMNDFAFPERKIESLREWVAENYRKR